MSKDPAFLFYSSDFLTGVSDLTMEERGQYITLLCIQHQKGRLSRKMISISCGNATADVMAKLRQDEQGLYYSPRLEEEAIKRAEHGEKQRQRALDGWKKRKATADTTANATALPLEDVNENENIIPSIEDYIKYAVEKKPDVDKQSVSFKYDAWVQNGWKDGNNKPIVNWKTKLLNTLPYLKDRVVKKRGVQF